MKKYYCIFVLFCFVLMALAMSFTALSAQAQAPVVSTRTYNHALDADLRAAVKANDVKRVSKLLSRGADPNTKNDDDTSTPLLGSINGTSNLDITRALVEAGADLEAGNSQGNAPLIFAALNGRNDIIEYLLQRGANIEGNKFDGLTALMVAATAGETETVRFLIAAGADVNARSTTNGTPLIYGCGKTIAGTGNLEIIKILVNAGADVSVKATNDKTAQDTAASYGLNDIADYLYSIDVRDRALFNAIAKIFNERLTSDPSSLSAKWQAVKDALAKGANPRFSNSETGVTPLMFLAYNLPGADDATVQQIIAHSDLNAQENKFGVTALHVAADGNNLKMAQWLIKAGANLNIVNNKQQTPLDMAMSRDSQDVVDALQNAGAKKNNAMDASNTASTTSTTDALEVNFVGSTTLMLLVNEKPFDAAKAVALLKAGVDVNAGNVGGWTALHFACDGSSPEAVRFLLQNGAKSNQANKQGDTALMRSANLKSEDDALDIVTQLIAAGADVNAKSRSGVTPLSSARERGNLRVTAVLIKAGAKDDARG